jgi:hypothetical protein
MNAVLNLPQNLKCDPALVKLYVCPKRSPIFNCVPLRKSRAAMRRFASGWSSIKRKGSVASALHDQVVAARFQHFTTIGA